MSLTNSLGIKIGQHFSLTHKDFEGDFPHNKSETALIGLAIDAHIKRFLADKNIIVPTYVYETFDFQHDGKYFDIKSFSSNSITVSRQEWLFASNQVQSGADVYYLIFKQLSGLKFKYMRMTSFKKLNNSNKIIESKFENGGYFFSPTVQLV